jgi:hypothetical protein
VQWFGKAVNFNRFLGQVDLDDPTNLPVGLGAVCRNTDFTRDTGGATHADTRAGNNLAMQLVGPNGQPSVDPATGGIFFRYSPVLATDPALFPPTGRFEMPILFEGGGCLQRENPVGRGRCQKLPASALFTPPQNSHMMGASAGNKVYAAFSDLKKPTAGGALIDPRAISTNGANAVNPIGMKPVGWYWQPNTAVLAGEICCPSAPVTGNGHTYQAQNSGTTGANQPVWPLTEGGTVVDNGITWKELTMVMANRLDPPPAPVLAVDHGAGTFPAGDDLYVVISLVNNQGESLPSTAAVYSGTLANDAVNATLPALAALPGWVATLAAQYLPTGINVYTAAVAHGAAAPPLSAYQRYAADVALGTVELITAPGSGVAPPTSCTARVVPGQLPTPDTQPVVQRDPGGGTFAAGRDVYVLMTYTNAAGETKAGPASSIVDTNLNDAVMVSVEVPEDDLGIALFDIASVGLYEADVVTGTPAPPSSAFSLVGYYQAGATPIITATAAGANPPTANTTGPAGNIAADTSTGGANGTQGYRYAALLFVNANQTTSGFTIASVVRYIVDEDGWELGFFNIATGPGNIVARLVAPSVADASQDGPFDWIGNINLLAPTANVVYPMQTPIDEVEQSATAIFDNVTTQAVFNFTDTYLTQQNNVDDRTDILPPFQACRIDFLKTINSLAYSGVLGYTGGGLISIPGDYESVYADTGPAPFPADGQRCYGFTDAYKSVIFALRENGGYSIQPNSGNPSGWDIVQRWDQVGPCGFRAWDAIGKFIIFVHRSGVYRYDQSDPDLMTKEIPKQWSTINWDYGHKIAVTIDEDTHTVRIQVPTGQSTENNQEFCLSYIEGWQNPIHFSTFSGKEISMDAARRWSFNDIAATFAIRMDRTLPPGPAFADGPDWTLQPDSAFGKSQLLFFDSAPDGAVQARTPGSWADNAAGIDWQYETVSASFMQAVCKPEGINLNVAGHGLITAEMIAARNRVEGPGGELANALPLGDGQFALDSGQQIGITLKCEPVIDEYWRVRFTNGKQPGAWASLKTMNVYVIPFTVGRGAWESNNP